MIAGKRFVICGLSRLTTRVARILAARGAEVVIVRGEEGAELVGLVENGARVLCLSGDREGALRAAGVAEAACVLALAEDDMANLQTTVAAREIAPEVPVVLRAFDPMLADQLEQGLNVRRAYSVSALSAPAFVAAALAEEVIETMRLGDAVVPICRLSVRPGSPIIGHTARELKRMFRCGVLARAGVDGVWRHAFEDEERFTAGEQALVGGVLGDVLDLARRNSPLFTGRERRPPALFRCLASARRAVGTRLRQPDRAPRREQPAPPHVTLLPKLGVVLGLLLALAVIVFAQALHLPPIDALYFVVTTATTTGYGDISLREAPAWLKLFGCAVMLSGGALLAVLFSHLASVATAERLEEQMGRRARRLSGHAVVAGLGNVGYRVTRILSELGIPSAVLELAPDARFVEAVRQRAVVLSGDARLPENLERASIRQAAIFLACTDNDLTNVLACLHARRINPTIRTVARLFDDLLAERLTAAFQIDAAVSAGKVAAGAFVGAATDERGLRPFQVGSQSYLAFRYDVTETVLLAQIEAWRAAGLRILAFRRHSADTQPPSELAAPLEPGDAAIVAGPEATLRALLFDSEPPRHQGHQEGDDEAIRR